MNFHDLPEGPSWQVQEWRVHDIAPLLASSLQARNFERGRLLFSVAHCCDCHRFCGVGGGVGPDLSALADRYNAQEALVAILEPNQVIAQQYSTVVIQTVSGREVIGRVLNSNSHQISVHTNDLDPTAVETIKRQDITLVSTRQISTMPTGLLNAVSQDDILDLLAYLLSDGNSDNPMFQPLTDTGETWWPSRPGEEAAMGSQALSRGLSTRHPSTRNVVQVKQPDEVSVTNR